MDNMGSVIGSVTGLVDAGSTIRSGVSVQSSDEGGVPQTHQPPHQSRRQYHRQPLQALQQAQPLEGVPRYNVSIVTADPVITVVDHLMSRLNSASVELRERRLLREDLQVRCTLGSVFIGV